MYQRHVGGQKREVCNGRVNAGAFEHAAKQRRVGLPIFRAPAQMHSVERDVVGIFREAGRVSLRIAARPRLHYPSEQRTHRAFVFRIDFHGHHL